MKKQIQLLQQQLDEKEGELMKIQRNKAKNTDAETQSVNKQSSCQFLNCKNDIQQMMEADLYLNPSQEAQSEQDTDRLLRTQNLLTSQDLQEGLTREIVEFRNITDSYHLKYKGIFMNLIGDIS